MGSIWLPELDDWLADAGLPVVTWDGWLTRSRLSGGYDDILGIGLHHDASSVTSDWRGSCRLMWETSPVRPIGALYLRRDGGWVVGAAGATNTQGLGGPYPTSRRTTPLDAANRYWIAVEADNNGVGEPWPAVQLDSYVAGCAAIIAGLARDKNIHLDPLRDVVAHFEWAPTRKIDPAGPPTPYARPGDSHMRWNMTQFRADVAAATQPPDGDDMRFEFYQPTGEHHYDSRQPPPGDKLAAGVDRTIPMPRCADGSIAVGAVVTITVDQPAAAGWGAVVPNAYDGTSCINFVANQAIANTTVVELAANGTFKVRANQPTHVVVDVIGLYHA